MCESKYTVENNICVVQCVFVSFVIGIASNKCMTMSLCVSERDQHNKLLLLKKNTLNLGNFLLTCK